MPSTHKVSIFWQIVFTFISFVDLWAAYRIKKLQKFLLFFVIPVTILNWILPFAILSISSPGDMSTLNDSFSNETDFSVFMLTYQTTMIQNIPYYAIITVSTILSQSWKIYLIYTWSKQFNQSFTDEKMHNS